MSILRIKDREWPRTSGGRLQNLDEFAALHGLAGNVVVNLEYAGSGARKIHAPQDIFMNTLPTVECEVDVAPGVVPKDPWHRATAAWQNELNAIVLLEPGVAIKERAH